MKQEGLKERVELLEAGEKLGYPRLGYGRSTKIPHDKRIPQGQTGWEAFCAHAHIRRVLPALRVARVLRDNNVTPYHPISGAEVREVVMVDNPLPNVNASVGVPVDIFSDIVDFSDGPKVVEQVVPLARPKKGGHKKPRRANRGSTHLKKKPLV